MSAVDFDDDLHDRTASADADGDDHGNAANAAAAAQKAQSEYDDVLDAEHFDPVEYVNRHFPSEHSLENLDTFITRAKAQLYKLNGELLSAVRKQSLSAYQAEKDLERATSAIAELFRKVAAIRNAAEESEAMVEELCRDIRQLDYAKRNLTTAITTVRRIQMLVESVEKLKAATARKEYTTAAQYVQVSSQLMSYFEQYSHVPKVRELDDQVKALKIKLERSVFDVFVHFSLDDDATAVTPQIHGACEVIDALGPSCRKKFISWFVENQLEQYTLEFERKPLEETEARFTFCKRRLRAMAGALDTVFPADWCLPQEFAVEFCLATRKQLQSLMNQNMEVPVFMKVLQKTIDFEKELSVKFSRDAAKPLLEGERDLRVKQQLRKLKEQKKTKEDVVKQKQSYKFHGLISSSFEPYMDMYIHTEHEALNDMLSSVLSSESWRPDQETKMRILASSTDIFMCIKQTLERCAAFSRGQPMLEITREFGQTLFEYADALKRKIPQAQPVETNKLTDKLKDMIMLNQVEEDGEPLTEAMNLFPEETALLCYLINTSEYCYNTCGQLTEAIKRKIDEPFAPEIDLSKQQEEFSELINKCIRALIMGVETECNPHFNALIRVKWGEWASVGDISPWASGLADVLKDFVERCEKQMEGTTYLRFFCDKLASWFMPKYTSVLFKCRRVTPVAAQQLLMDTQFLHSTLLKLCEGAKSYVKMVGRDMGRIESMLKVLQTPAEGLVPTYRAILMNAPGAKTDVLSAVAELQRMCELKGMTKKEWSPYTERLERELRESAGEQVSASMDSSSAGDRGRDGGSSAAGPTDKSTKQTKMRNIIENKLNLKKLFNS